MSPQPPSQPQETINHFSHHHPLHLFQIPTNHHHLQPPLPSCSACNLKTLEPVIYTCTSCNFFLHKKCSQMPSKITHPSHKDHVLTLLVKPEYQDGTFTCDACGKLGQGFVYNCKPCNLDIHVLCASMPLTLNSQSHFHTLELVFSPSYGDKRFNCDICNTQGLNHWLYSCRICGFDAHLDCANSQLQHPGMASNTGGSRISATGFKPKIVQETATGIPMEQFMANQCVQSPIGINGSAQNNEHMMLRQLPAGGYQDSYNQNYLQPVTAGGGGGIGGSRGILGGGGGGLSGGGGVAIKAGGKAVIKTVQFVVQALTGLPIGSLGGGGGGGGGGCGYGCGHGHGCGGGYGGGCGRGCGGGCGHGYGRGC